VTPDFGLTPELLELVKQAEGWEPKAYLCPAGYPTIGYGHRVPSLNHREITLEEGERMLKDDLRRFRNAAVHFSPRLEAPENERRLAAIVDFCYNLGDGAYKGSTLRLMVDRGWWPSAAVQMRKWVYATDPKTRKKVKLPGLVKRRDITAKWLEEG
jgi:lysozyme